MRKVKSTALLGAFVAISGVMALSHEARATQISVVTQTYARETVNSSTLSISSVGIVSSVNENGTENIVFTLQNGYFTSGTYNLYTPSTSSAAGTAICTNGAKVTANQTSITLTSCTTTSGSTYYLAPGSATSATPAEALPIVASGSGNVVLNYSSNISIDTPASAALANILQQLAASVTSTSSCTIDPTSLTSFKNCGGGSIASNNVVMSNSADGGGWVQSITTNSQLNFVFNGVPSSVNQIMPNVGGDYASSVTTIANNSATVTVALSSTGLLSNSSDTYTFTFSNSGDIGAGNITVTAYSVSSATAGNIIQSITYLNNVPFLSFVPGAISIYLPNVQSGSTAGGWVKITGPSSMSVASISVLNTGVSCSLSSLTNSETNGTATTIYINLGNLQSACTGSNLDWVVGLPVEINLTGAGVSTSNVAAYAYQNYNGFFKRIPALLNGPSEVGQ